MKKKISLVFAVILAVSLLMGTVAYADNGAGSRVANLQQRQQYMSQIRPLIQEVLQNRAQLCTMELQLTQLHQEAKECIAQLRNDPGSVTDEQIAQIKQIIAQIREGRDALVATNSQMVQYRQKLRAGRTSGNYEEIMAEYRNIISLQEQRMECLQQLISLNQQIVNI